MPESLPHPDPGIQRMAEPFNPDELSPEQCTPEQFTPEQFTLAQPCRHEQIIRKSRFLALAAPCPDEDAALAFIEQASDPDCRHNCWAFKAGDVYRFHDAGEPGGTAGQPILQAIEQQGLDQVAVVVSRWFGGVKLGAGGLVRAYGGSAAECLRQAETRPLVHTVQLQLMFPFALVDSLHHLMERHQVAKLSERYTSEGVTLAVELPQNSCQAFVRDVQEVARGQCKFDPGAA